MKREDYQEGMSVQKVNNTSYNGGRYDPTIGKALTAEPYTKELKGTAYKSYKSKRRNIYYVMVQWTPSRSPEECALTSLKPAEISLQR